MAADAPAMSAAGVRCLVNCRSVGLPNFWSNVVGSRSERTLVAVTIWVVVVVDNGSGDGSWQAAEAWGARVIQLERNYGFAHAVNVGIEATDSEYVAIFNNDIELYAGWLTHIVPALGTDPKIGYAVGKIFVANNNGGTLDGTFDAVSRAGCAWRCGQGREDGPRWSEPRRIACAPMTAAVFRREVFATVGLLDERFESYLEDVDYGLRCVKAGYEGIYVPAAEARHWGSATLGVWHEETVRRMSRNQLYLVAKHFPRSWGWRLGWPVLVGQLLWGGVALRHGRFGPWIRGKYEGCCNYKQLRNEMTLGDLSGELEKQEETIRELQQSGKVDLYWRLYFRLIR